MTGILDVVQDGEVRTADDLNRFTYWIDDSVSKSGEEAQQVADLDQDFESSEQILLQSLLDNKFNTDDNDVAEENNTALLSFNVNDTILSPVEYDDSGQFKLIQPALLVKDDADETTVVSEETSNETLNELETLVSAIQTNEHSDEGTVDFSDRKLIPISLSEVLDEAEEALWDSQDIVAGTALVDQNTDSTPDFEELAPVLMTETLIPEVAQIDCLI